MSKRRSRVIEMYLQGFCQWQIAKELGVDRQTIWLDLNAIMAEWKKDRIVNFERYRHIELEKLNRLESEAFEAWEKSKLNAVSLKENVVEAGDGETGLVTASERTTKGQVGDPQFLEVMRKLSADRRKILGLDAPMKIAPTTPDGEEPYTMAIKEAEQKADGLTDEQLRQVAAVRSIFDSTATNLN